MSELVHASTPQTSLRPGRVAIWPTEDGRFGLDFTYHGATGYADAEFADGVLSGHGIATSFRQELDGAWSVRLGPVSRTDMLSALNQFAF